MSKLHSVTAVLCFFAAGILNLEAGVVKPGGYEVYTPDELTYQFFPAVGEELNFKVKAENDAHIALTIGPEESDPMYEVFIGGWNNMYSTIRKNRSKPDVVEAYTKFILDEDEFRGFWIKWSHKRIMVGWEGYEDPFLTYEDPYMFEVGYVGFCTAWGATGEWIIEGPRKLVYNWGKGAIGVIPSGALSAGIDAETGDTIYIARAEHEGAMLPGKFVPSHAVTYVPWGGEEHAKTEYEILCGTDVKWVKSMGGVVPLDAVEGGKTEDGEVLYIGRVEDGDKLMVGKVQPSHGVCYVPYDGEELAYVAYEVLVM